MADRHLDDVFGLRPVPKRKCTDHKGNRLKEAHSCAPDRICIYVLGPDDPSVSKVGVSRTPYCRMRALRNWRGQELRMCYFAGVSRSEGYQIETAYHAQRKECGEQIEGEWVRAHRAGITKTIRAIMADMGVVPSIEVGDTGEQEDGDGASRAYCVPGGLVSTRSWKRLTSR